MAYRGKPQVSFKERDGCLHLGGSALCDPPLFFIMFLKGLYGVQYRPTQNIENIVYMASRNKGIYE